MATGRVMIVEDDEDVRGAMVVFLESEGYAVDEAAHGEEALARLRATGGACVILLDLFMPVMNGWTFRAEQVRDPGLASIPVVVLSADAQAAQQSSSLGAAGWMVKPIEFERLLELIVRFCGQP